jgi:hypothetical protein
MLICFFSADVVLAAIDDGFEGDRRRFFEMRLCGSVRISMIRSAWSVLDIDLDVVVFDVLFIIAGTVGFK